MAMFSHSHSDPYALYPIGIIQSPFREKYEAPRQGVVGKPRNAKIHLYPKLNLDQALKDLEGFERVWILYWFHLARSWNAVVIPPRASRIKRGVFATRAPHRPNPIGLTAVKLISVKKLIVEVEGVDLIDGTPILDIKPYIPYADSFPDSNIGWLEPFVKAQDALGYDQKHKVMWSSLAKKKTAWLENLLPYEWKQRVEVLLGTDPFPHPYKRIAAMEKGYRMGLKRWRFLFHIEGNVVHVNDVVSAYEPEVLEVGHPKYPGQRLAGFHKAFEAAFTQ